MKTTSPFSPLRRRLVLAGATAPLVAIWPSAWATNLLPSWREGPARDAIIKFVESAINFNEGTYVKPENRIAVFDNDGTL